jgi:hypothetical protein
MTVPCMCARSIWQSRSHPCTPTQVAPLLKIMAKAIQLFASKCEHLVDTAPDAFTFRGPLTEAATANFQLIGAVAHIDQALRVRLL